MIKQVIYILCISLLLVSCNIKKENSPIILYALQNDSIQNMLLDVDEEGDIIDYTYLHENDSNKNLALTLDSEKDVIIFNSVAYHPIKNTYKTKEYQFKMYQNKDAQSHKLTLVFHKEYGLLASLVYDADFLFLNDSLSKEDRKIIFKELFLALNTIETE